MVRHSSKPPSRFARKSTGKRGNPATQSQTSRSISKRDQQVEETSRPTINAADDERNPPETGVTEAAVKRIKNGKIYLIPASSETRGHLTTGDAKFYSGQLQELLRVTPQRAM